MNSDDRGRGSGRHPHYGRNGHLTAQESNGHNPNGAAQAVGWRPRFADDEADDEHALDLEQAWEVIREGRRTITLVTIGVLALVLGVTLASRMEFTLRSSLYLGDLQSQGGVFDAIASELNPFGGEKGAVGTQVEILKSRELLTRAILASGLNTRLTPDDWSPPRYWRWRLSKRDLRQLEGAWGEVRATETRRTGIVGGTRDFDIVFTSPNNFNILEDGHQIGESTLGKPFVAPGIEITLVQGPDRMPLPGSRYKLEVDSLEDTLEEVSESLTAESPKALPGSQVNVIYLTFKSKAPYQAQLFIEDLMKSYLAQNLEWKTEEASAAERFLANQLSNIRDSFEKAGRDLADFKKQSTTIVLSEEAKTVIEQMAAFEQQRITARLQVAALEQVKASLAKGTVPTEAYLLGEAQDTVFASMSEGLVKAQLEYKRLSEQFTPDYPVVQDAHAALEAQLSAIRRYVDTRLARSREQVASLDTVLQRFEEKLKTLPDSEFRLASLTQQSEVYAKLYSFLLERQQQAALTKASTISKSRVLDAPILSYRESSPRLLLRIVLGLFVGLLLGVGIILIRWRLASTFQSEAEIRKVFDGLPLFASVPRIKEPKRRNGTDALRPLELLAADLRSNFAEAFRLLRTNIYYSGSAEHDKMILFSSSGPNDGKTLATLCLAGVLAADGKRVLVVDGDMRKPSHHILLRQPQHPGLSAILTGETTWRDAVHQVNTQMGTFDSISTGFVPPNPAELLSSPRLAHFLEEARNAYDFVIVDSPPYPIVSDAFVLGSHADRTLTVVRLGSSRRRATTEHVRRMSSRPHYGIVINAVTSDEAHGYYGYGYGQPAKSKRRRRSTKGTDVSLPS